VVSTSFTNSVSLARSHWGRKGPERADLKVRGEPEGLRFRTGADLVEIGWRVVSEELNQVEEEGRKAGRVVRV
jgi:hypothetical protein